MINKKIIRRIIRIVIILFIIITLDFLIPRLMPGDPVYNVLGDSVAHIDEESRTIIIHRYGLDRSLWDQYITYLNNLFHFNLGQSFVKNVPVSDLISRNLTWTLVLMIPSILIGSGIALLAGTWAGYKKGDKIDGGLTAFFTILSSMPIVVVSMVALSLFSYKMDLFPLGNYTSGGVEGVDYYVDVAWHLALPMATLTLMSSTYVFLLVRNNVTRIRNEYYILGARARGLNDTTISMRHALPNALPPYISAVALDMGTMVGGAMIIEVVFSLNGMGSLIYDAIINRDYPIIQGCFLVLAIFVLMCNTIADILYCVVNPRLRIQDGK